MINSDKFIGNAFTDDLYDAIYTGILKTRSEEETCSTVHGRHTAERLESPLKEQFTALFVELKIKNEPLDTNSVLHVCHRLLEQYKPSGAVRSGRSEIIRDIDGPDRLGVERQTRQDDERHGRDETGSPPPCRERDGRLRVVATTLPWPVYRTIPVEGADARLRFGRELFSNLALRSRGVERIETDTNTCETVPGFDFMTAHVTELGRLHNIVKEYVNADNCGLCRGRTAKALRNALQKEINSYYTYVNTWLRDNFEVLEHSSHTQQTFVSFDHDVLMRFRCLAKIVENSKSKSGCNLISTLIHSGIREIDNTILNEVTRPVQAMIVRWMAGGEIEDEYGEFFIVKTSSENYWHDSHALSSENTLDFLNERKLNDIYQTGKNMSFLLNVLSGPRVDAKIEKLRENIARLVDIGDGLLIELADQQSRASAIISDAVDQSSALLVQVLTDKYDMFLHFEGFRDYVLFGREDFYTHVMSKLEPYFGDKKMHNYQLKEIMETANDLMSTGDYDKKLFDNLKYRVDWTGEVNWDSFNFEYVTDEPLNQVFGPCSHHANVFEFLWRLKKVDWTAKKLWRELAYFVKKSLGMTELNLVLRITKALLASMISCVNEIQNFIFEMINEQWKRFMSEMYRATRVKTIKDAHMAFLESIAKCVDSSVSVNEYVDSLEKHVKKFAVVFGCFSDTLQRSPSPTESDPRAENNRLIDTFVDGIRAIKTEFETGLADLLLRLTDTETLDLAILSLRINFNGYYSSDGL